VLTVLKVLLERKELLEHREPLVLKEPLVQIVWFPAHKEPLVLKVLPALRGHRVDKGFKDL
jgi:hypothetical protein